MTAKPCYVIEFGTRRVEFFPLLLMHMQELGPIPPKEERKDDAMYERQMQSFLLSAQRGNPSVTREDVQLVVDTAHVAALTSAIYAMSKLPGQVGGVDPTSPQTGG